MITYALEKILTPEAFREILIDSGLGARRPIDDMERLRAMIENANLVLTARDAGKLVGIARSITDFVYCTYLSDLAVTESTRVGVSARSLFVAQKCRLPRPNSFCYQPRMRSPIIRKSGWTVMTSVSIWTM